MAKRRRKNLDPLATLGLFVLGAGATAAIVYGVRRYRSEQLGGKLTPKPTPTTPTVPTEPPKPKQPAKHYVKIEPCGPQQNDVCVTESDARVDVDYYTGQTRIIVDAAQLPVDVVVSVSNDYDPPAVQTQNGMLLVAGQSESTRDFVLRALEYSPSLESEDFSALVAVTFYTIGYEGQTNWNNAPIRIYVKP